MHKKIILIFAVMLLLAGCIPEKQPITSAVKETNDKDIEIYFCPAENCSAHLVEFINSAESYLHCAFYDIDLPEIINALKEKADDIDIKIVVDGDNYAIVSELEFARNDTSSQLMHNKFCVADGVKIFTGSFNPTFNDDRKNNNNILIIHSGYLAQNYEDEFSELWEGKFGKGAEVSYPIIYLNGIKIQNYFCPEDKCVEHIINELRNAKKSIYFMAFTFTENNIANMLAVKMSGDVSIKGVFEKTRKNEWTKFDFLKYQGADVRWDSNKYVMHHKVFIIDNETVITGSFNPTWSADKENDENILIIEDKTLADKYLEEFEKTFKNP